MSTLKKNKFEKLAYTKAETQLDKSFRSNIFMRTPGGILLNKK
jgi:hypothetical protein